MIYLALNEREAHYLALVLQEEGDRCSDEQDYDPQDAQDLETIYAKLADAL